MTFINFAMKVLSIVALPINSIVEGPLLLYIKYQDKKEQKGLHYQPPQLNHNSLVVVYAMSWVRCSANLLMTSLSMTITRCNHKTKKPVRLLWVTKALPTTISVSIISDLDVVHIPKAETMETASGRWHQDTATCPLQPGNGIGEPGWWQTSNCCRWSCWIQELVWSLLFNFQWWWSSYC